MRTRMPQSQSKVTRKLTAAPDDDESAASSSWSCNWRPPTHCANSASSPPAQCQIDNSNNNNNSNNSNSNEMKKQLRIPLLLPLLLGKVTQQTSKFCAQEIEIATS